MTKRRRTLPILFAPAMVTSLLSAPPLASFQSPEPLQPPPVLPPPPTNGDEVIEKRAVTQSPVATGQTVDWVITVDPADPALDERVIDTPGPNHTYVPGSGIGPPGWTRDELNVPGSVEWTPGGGTGTSVSVQVEPFSLVELQLPQSDGDGWAPILWTTPGGEERVYVVNHHSAEPSPGNSTPFKCFGVDGSSCGADWPRALPDGDPATVGDEQPTSHGPEGIRVVDDRLIYPSTIWELNNGTPGASTRWGVGCFDLVAESECGFLELGNNAGGQLTTQGSQVIEGPWVVGGNGYLLDHLMQLHCVDLSALTSCQGSLDLAALGMPVLPGSQALEDRGSGIVGEVDGDRLFLLASPFHTTSQDVKTKSNEANAARVICIEPGTQVTCAGWNQAHQITGSGVANLTLVRDANLVATHVCNFRFSGADIQCLRIDDPSVPADMSDAEIELITNSIGGVLSESVLHGSRTFFPDHGVNTNLSLIHI